ncbi:NmrA-like family-domain-containing protein [Talaromyces proteolyticus]|uniref:NmrA-like family-domain-containing protein n=1 Tax=Talaromyces proteolyticus TaxID=1131652 RepID=A0AAD4L806_9EURO|nr:NmrA-like family-domain-containing protein [Talaromyces proteolyticus]KAH8705589.1 NmrA-like family-domain-containing protein [Talaromyces proteolyticus]
MPKLVVVVGITGTQGGSVADALLQDPNYRVRGLTRNTDSDAAKTFENKGVEIVAADLNDEASLVKAFQGAYAIFAITNFFEPAMQLGIEGGKKVEFTQATNMIKAAKQTSTLEHYIWSTLPNSNTLSKGKFNVPFFDNKSLVDDYIRQDKEFLAKTTFVYFTFFSSNVFYPVFVPIHIKTANKYIQILPADAKTPISSLSDARHNIGIFIRSIIKNPPKTGGTYVLCNVEDLTLESYLAKWGEGTGLATSQGSTEVVEISLDKYRAIWPGYGDLMGEMIAFWADSREKSWTTPLGTAPIPVQGLMTEEDKKKIMSTVDAFKMTTAEFIKVV